MNIIAIGGGNLRKKETLAIDRCIVRLAKKSHPRALFIPTASGDSQNYCNTFDAVYRDLLGCRTDHLLLYRRQEDRAAAAEKIRAADIIYVGGGNTLRMMKLWRRTGLDAVLIKAAKQGKILAGLSAGAICWHEWGHSDSRSFSGKKNWAYIKVRALGVRPGLFCPHLDAEKRHASFKKMVAGMAITGIACDNRAAVWYHDKGATCLAAERRACVHVYTLLDNRVVQKSFKNGESIYTEQYVTSGPRKP